MQDSLERLCEEELDIVLFMQHDNWGACLRKPRARNPPIVHQPIPEQNLIAFQTEARMSAGVMMNIRDDLRACEVFWNNIL